MPVIGEPEVRRLRKRPLDIAPYKLRRAAESDYVELVKGSTVVYDEELGQVTVVYLELDDEFPGVTEALLSVPFSARSRTGGMVSTSATIGFAPRNTIRRDYCNAAALSRSHPEAHSRIASLAETVARYYEQYHPELYADHQRQVEKVLLNWRLENSVFTSGIINKNNPLLYHHDAGNFKNVWSNMLAFKSKVGGGYLSVPEYNLGFQIRDRSLLMFDGQNLLHGVTPIQLLAPDAYRYTIVFFSLRGMWQCMTPDEEMQRYRKVRTEREFRRAEAPVAENPKTYADLRALRAKERAARRGT